MQLSNLIIDPRVRSAWASIDLGTLLARRFWWRGVALYLTLAVPVFLLARLTTELSTWMPLLILWWFKPLFERPFLYSLSRELFSDRMSYWACLANYKQWLFPSLISIITIRRLSTNRGMYAPVSLLEQPSGSEYNKRTSVLGLKFSNASTWLTVVLYHFESFFVVALLAFVVFLFPDLIDGSSIEPLLDGTSEYVIVRDLCMLLIFAVIAPFYCAAGFCLYICRRIELEGWDIEICFREWMLNYTPIVERANSDGLKAFDDNRRASDD